MDKLFFLLILIFEAMIGNVATNEVSQSEDIPSIDNNDSSIENDNADFENLYKQVNEHTKDIKENEVKYEITENNPENVTFNFTNIINSIRNETTTEIHEKPFTNPKYLSILHIKFDNEDKFQNILPSENIDPFQVVKPNLNILNFLSENAMQYIDGVKKGVVNGINSLGNINYQPYINRVVSLPNLAAAPVAVFNKLHRKTVDTASRIHDFFLGQNIRH